MIASICLLSCALIGQARDRAEWQLAPQLTPGLELVYHGVYTEEALIPHVQHLKQYRLESTLLVLEPRGKDWQVALLTALSIQDPLQPLDKKREGPSSVRLELLNVDFQGRVRVTEKKVLETAVIGPPTLEAGFLVPSPIVKVGRNFVWQVAEDGRPAQHWQIVGTETCNNVTCIKATCTQQSEDWDRPRADQLAWSRRDTVWLLPQLNVAQKVERIIERRDPARQAPTQRATVRYELDSRLKYPASMVEERRQDIAKAKKYYEEAQPLLRQPILQRTQIDSLSQRVSMYMERQTPTPYRKALVHVKTLLENTKKADLPVHHATDDPMPHTVQALTVGQRAPDFAVSCLTEAKTTRLQNHVGKPVLVVFYNPGTAIGREVLGYARQVSQQHGKAVGIMAMAVTQDADLVRQQHRSLGLTFPVLDGNGMRLTFGADQTPRVVLLDGDALVRMAQTGWGYTTAHEVDEALKQCLKK